MITSVYIAAPYPLKESAIALRQTLHDADIGVTSRWLDMQEDNDWKTAEMDLEDVRLAQAVVLINPAPWANSGSGGRHVEIGAALTIGMPVFILGGKSNVFHTLPSVRCAGDSIPALLCMLNAAEITRAEIFTSTWMLRQLVARVHRANKQWWIDLDTGAPIQRNVGELLMLVVSELAEAMEGHRKNLPDDKLPHRPMFSVETADALIRILDMIGGLALDDVPLAFEEKMVYNAQREDHTAAHRKSLYGKKY